MLQEKRILVGVTGSIAAYKACDLVQRLKEKGAAVRVVMTHSATRIIHPNALAALTGSAVIQDAWEDVGHGAMPHIEMARWTDAFVIAPCTAHTLAELSMGLTGSAVSMTALAYQGPLIVAPAMNTVMLESAPVQEHLQRLTEGGVSVLSTASGDLACGEVGEGKHRDGDGAVDLELHVLSGHGRSSVGAVVAALHPCPAGRKVADLVVAE